MSFCQKCGNQIPDGTAFCANCGAPVAAASQPTVNQPVVQPIVMVKPKIPGRGLGISSMVLGIIGLLYAFSLAVQLPVALDQLDSVSRWVDTSPAYETFIPLILITSVMSILSLCFAPAAIKRGYKNGISISGLVMGLIGVLCFAIAIFSVVSYL